MKLPQAGLSLNQPHKRAEIFGYWLAEEVSNYH